MTTLGTEEGGHYREVAVVERLFTRVNVWTVCQKKWPLCREVAITEGSTVFTKFAFYKSDYCQTLEIMSSIFP